MTSTDGAEYQARTESHGRIPKTTILTLLTILFVYSVSASGPILDKTLQNYEPVPAEAGDYVDVFINVENTEPDPADSLKCQLNPRYPFELHDNQPTSHLTTNEPETRDIGRLEGYRSQLLQYRLAVDDQAIEGYNSFEIKCSGLESDRWIYDNFELMVVEGVNLGLNDVEVVDGDLEPSTDDVSLEVEIANLGGSKADLTTAKLDLPEGFTASESYSDRDTVGRIESGDVAVAEFEIDTSNIDPGEYEATMTLQYDSQSTSIEELTVPLMVENAPEFNVSELGSFEAGTEEDFSLTVDNDGAEADSVSLHLQESSDHPFEFTDSYGYIGDMEKGVSANGNFEIEVDDGAPSGNYLADVEVRYTDGDDVRTKDQTLEVEVNEGLGQNVSLYAGLIIALVVLLAAFLKKEAIREKFQGLRQN